ncbi:DrmB family protein [Maribacter sp. Asnod2-G09]|uniref:DrmB family protein n=1 Tax=Maribacter sp. Asnod2-G09 TaxID=3160577 RepID=UPI00386FAF69
MSKSNNVRSSQLLSPFGVGQIVNFPKELSVMVCGLSLWDDKITEAKVNRGTDSINESELRFNEKRLEKLLEVDYFMKPFEYKTSGAKNNHLTIPVVRFPAWHYCTNSRCGRMREVPLGQANQVIECIDCWDGKSKYKSKMIPVRFVAACPLGHIQDVPFEEWVHNGSIPNDEYEHKLSYHTGGGSGDLGSIRINCTKINHKTREQERCCTKTLGGLMNIRKEGEEIFDSALARIGFEKGEGRSFEQSNPNNDNPSGQYCKGHKPWLGLEGVNEVPSCGRHLQVLIRGGSNVHFSDIQSAIYLPKASKDADQHVLAVIDQLGIDELRSFYEQDGGSVILPAILGTHSVVRNSFITKEALLEGVLKELVIEDIDKDYGDLSPELKLRFEEYEYILSGRNSENSDFKAVVENFENYVGQEILEKYFDCVVLIEKLKETRVFTGFSRINPSNRLDKSELSNKPVNWLPAIEVYGEGIFLKFKDSAVDAWLNKNRHHFKGLLDRYDSSMQRRRPQDDPKNVNPFFVTMHTFAHQLIKRLCFDCGYGSSSLRERLYFSDNPESRMNGILIYTSSSDSEGSLGGLVRQGKSKNLEALVSNSIADADWCSADPVCSDIGRVSGQGPDNVNGSACHNCCIVPETSCEEFNTLLDRTSMVGSLDDKDIGFFS